MARVDLATQQIVQTGLDVAMAAPTVDGDIVDCGATALIVRNASGAPITVTIGTPPTIEGLAIADRTHVVPVAGTTIIGPLPASLYGQLAGADKGRAYVDYSAQASVSRAVVKF